MTGTFETVGVDGSGMMDAGIAMIGLRVLRAEHRKPPLAPAPLLDQLVAAGGRGFRDLS